MPTKKQRPVTKKDRTRSHRLAPQIIDDEIWFYEARRGLLVVHEFHDEIDGRYIRTDQFVIPWRMVTAAAQRHELKPVVAKSLPSTKG